MTVLPQKKRGRKYEETTSSPPPLSCKTPTQKRKIKKKKKGNLANLKGMKGRKGLLAERKEHVDFHLALAKMKID